MQTDGPLPLSTPPPPTPPFNNSYNKSIRQFNPHHNHIHTHTHNPVLNLVLLTQLLLHLPFVRQRARTSTSRDPQSIRFVSQFNSSQVNNTNLASAFGQSEEFFFVFVYSIFVAFNSRNAFTFTDSCMSSVVLV